MHAYGLAKKLGAPRLLVPPNAGVGSALGFFTAPRAFDLVRSHKVSLADADFAAIEKIFRELEADGEKTLKKAGKDEAVRFGRSLDMRFVGQGSETNVPLSEKDFTGQKKEEIRKKFDQIYEKLYGRTYPDSAVEFINFKVRASLPERLFKFSKLGKKGQSLKEAVKGQRPAYSGIAKDFIPYTVYDRYKLFPNAKFKGPAIIEEKESTLIVGEDTTVSVDDYGFLWVDLGTAQGTRSKDKARFLWFYRAPCAVRRAPLFILPHHAYHFPLDPEIALVNEDRRHAGVGRAEFHTVIPLIILLDRGFVVDEGHHRLSVFSARLLAHDDEISVQDPVFLHGIPFDLENKVISLPDHGGRDFDHVHGFHGLDRFSGSHSSKEGKLEAPGFHRADHFDGSLQVFSVRKTDIAFPFQGLEVGGDRVVRIKTEVGADFFETRRSVPVADVFGYKPQKFFLFFRQLHLPPPWLSGKLTVLNNFTVSFYESQGGRKSFSWGEMQRRRLKNECGSGLKKAEGIVCRINGDYVVQPRATDSIALPLADAGPAGEVLQLNQFNLPAMLVNLVLPVSGICQNPVGQ